MVGTAETLEYILSLLLPTSNIQPPTTHIYPSIMKLTHVTLTAMALLSRTMAQGLSDLPDCAKSCATNSIPAKCGIDVACVCEAKSFLGDITCCVADKCSKEDQEKTLKAAKSICARGGVTDLPDTVACSSAASNASTGSSTATASPTTTSSAAAKTTETSTLVTGTHASSTHESSSSSAAASTAAATTGAAALSQNKDASFMAAAGAAAAFAIFI